MGRKLDTGRQAIVDRVIDLQRCNRKDDCVLTLRGTILALEDFDYAIAKYNRETVAERLKTPE